MEYEKWKCQRCGEPTGYLGRLIEWIYRGLIVHDCSNKPELTDTSTN